MSDLAVRFKNTADVTFYKILAALTSMKGKGYIGKVKFEEGGFKEKYVEWTAWDGEIQFLSKEAMEIFGKKIRRRPRSSSA